MSGITGMYCLNGTTAEERLLRSMSSAISHRGPDDQGEYKKDSVGLAHRMLHTTPESLDEKQPFIFENGKYVITADARIDNRDALITELGLRNKGEIITDSEIILYAFIRWEEKCAEKLLGVFAFAIWDKKEQSLYCARDQFGIKTLYYHYHPEKLFTFASEIKALFQHPRVPRQINELRIADYLSSLLLDKSITFYKDICQLEPAHFLVIGPAGLTKRQYWSLDPEKEIHYKSDEEYAEALREIFIESVRCRLRSVYPVGSSLSGGLDSSSVAAVAQMQLKEDGKAPLHTFSAIFDDVPESDERQFIHKVLQHGEYKPHFIHLDQFGALEDIEKLIWHNDGPLFIRNAFLWKKKYEIARENGVRIVLDGEDGDTVISHAESYLAEIVRSGDWKEYALESKGLLQHFESYDPSPTILAESYVYSHLASLRENDHWYRFFRDAAGFLIYSDTDKWDFLRNQLVKPFTPDIIMKIWHRLHGRTLNTKQNRHGKRKAKSILNAEFAEKISPENRKSALVAGHRYSPGFRSEHFQALTLQSPWAYEENDKLAAAYQIEARHPFHDRRLVEFSLGIPPHLKLKNGWPRWILRKSMENILPEAIAWRVGKSNLGHNFKRSLIDIEHDRLQDLLITRPGRLETYLDIPLIQKAFELGVANYIWPAAVLSIWLREEKT